MHVQIPSLLKAAPSLAQGDQLSEEECDKISQNLANLSNANRSLNSILGTFSEKFSHSQWLSGAGHLAGMISAPISGATAGYKLVFHAGLKRFRKFGAEITLAVRNDLVADSTRAMVGGVAVAGGTSVANTGIVKIGEHFEVPLILSVGDLGDYAANKYIDKLDGDVRQIEDQLTSNRESYQQERTKYDEGGCKRFE